MNSALNIQTSKANRTIKASRKTLLTALTSFLLLTAVSSRSYAQSLELGLKGGINYMKMGGRSFDNKNYLGAVGGLYGEYHLTSMWGLQAELVFSQVTAKTGDQFNQIFSTIGAVSDQLTTNDYITLPVMVSFRPIPELSILAGAQYGFLFNQTKGLYQSQGMQNYKAFNQNDISIVFGGQLNLNRVKFGLRFVNGLNQLNHYNTTDTWRQYGFQAYLGYRIADIKLKKKKH